MRTVLRMSLKNRQVQNKTNKKIYLGLRKLAPFRISFMAKLTFYFQFSLHFILQFSFPQLNFTLKVKQS